MKKVIANERTATGRIPSQPQIQQISIADKNDVLRAARQSRLQELQSKLGPALSFDALEARILLQA